VSAPPEPRLTPRPFAEWDEADRAALLPFLRRPEVYLSGAPDAPPMPVVLELFAHHRALSQAWLPFTEMLSGADARLDPALRELLILRVAWKTRSGYEWRSHQRLAAEAGLSAARVDAVPAGPGADAWTPVERALLTAADEMVDAFCVREETWRTLASYLEPDVLLEALFVVAGYLGLAAVLNSAGLEPGIDGAPAGRGRDQT
jgi:4-carboxymuconolactone decarboxylase